MVILNVHRIDKDNKSKQWHKFEFLLGYDVKDYGNITEERASETSQMSKIHGHDRLLRNPEEVAIFNGKVF